MKLLVVTNTHIYKMHVDELCVQFPRDCCSSSVLNILRKSELGIMVEIGFSEVFCSCSSLSQSSSNLNQH